MDKSVLRPFQIFSLTAISSMLGIPISIVGFSPAFFWTVIALFLLQSVGLALLRFSFSRTGLSDAREHLSVLLSAVPAKLLLSVLGIALTLRSSLAIAAQTGCVSMYLLEDTPSFAVMLILLITGFFALLPGIRRLSGVSTLLVLLLPLMLAAIIGTGLVGADLGELRTLVQPQLHEFSSALAPPAVTASGAECALLFIGYGKSRRRSLFSAAAAPAVCAAIFVALCCATVGTVGTSNMASLRFPIVEAARQISLGGIELTERFDLPLITVSLFASIVQIALFTLCASLSFCTAFGCKRTGLIALWLLPVQLVLSLFVRTASANSIILSVFTLPLTAFSIVIFPLLAALSLTCRKKRGSR